MNYDENCDENYDENCEGNYDENYDENNDKIHDKNYVENYDGNYGHYEHNCLDEHCWSRFGFCFICITRQGLAWLISINLDMN